MNKLRTAIASLVLCLGLTAQAQENPYRQYTMSLPFAMSELKAPTFPSYQVNLKDYGAKGDGTALCTEAFARAIDDLRAQGTAVLASQLLQGCQTVIHEDIPLIVSHLILRLVDDGVCATLL